MKAPRCDFSLISRPPYSCELEYEVACLNDPGKHTTGEKFIISHRGRMQLLIALNSLCVGMQERAQDLSLWTILGAIIYHEMSSSCVPSKKEHHLFSLVHVGNAVFGFMILRSR